MQKINKCIVQLFWKGLYFPGYTEMDEYEFE